VNYYQISFKDRKSLEKNEIFITKLQMINFLYFLMFKYQIVYDCDFCEFNLWSKKAKRVFARKRRRKKLDAPEGRRCLKCDYGRMKKRKKEAKRRGRDKPSSRNLGTSWR